MWKIIQFKILIIMIIIIFSARIKNIENKTDTSDSEKQKSAIRKGK